MNVECHITIPVEDAPKVYALFAQGLFMQMELEPRSWKTSEITGDPLLGPKAYFYLTAHDIEVSHMFTRMVAAQGELAALGIRILRTKIELIIHDKRTP